MSTESTNKPEVILKLEQALGFALAQVALGEIGEWKGEKCADFALNEQGEVVDLRLQECEIKDLGPLQHLTALTTLSLSGNQIEDLSPLQHLTALTSLDLGENPIKDLSPLQHLTALTSLDLWGNQLEDLSPLQHLTILTVLYLSNNQIKDLSPLQHLTVLTTLDLGGNQIKDLNPLQGLTALTELELWGNQIEDLSPLQGLTALTTLNLSWNQLTDLGPLQHLTALTTLSLSGNQIKDLSPLQHLTALTTLSLSGNQIKDLSPLQHLTALTSLDLGENQIKDFSPLQHLTVLTTLHLSNLFNLSENQIKDLSPLQSLTALTWLSLTYNEIQTITLDFLNHFPKLGGLYLFGNPIKNLPEEIFSSGNVLTPVRHYLEDLEKQPVQAYQAKVILIGNGRVGKTCLLKRWLDNTFNADEPSTHAIQLRHYPLKKLAKEKQFKTIQLHIWDFGGQDIYHATHRLFMKTKAIFVLVWDTETENTPEQVETIDGKEYRYQNYPLNYWLDYAKHLGNNSPVLIVQTKKQRDGEQDPKNLNELRKHYPIIASIAVESSQDKHNGFPIFEQHLIEQVEKSLETHCTALPASWWQVQTQVQKWQNPKKPKKTLSMSEFEKCCQKFGLDNEHVPSVLSYLHNSGWLFYQENLFQNQIIVDQKWAIDAVYTLFDRKGLFPELVKTGEFGTAQLKHVWQQFDESEQALFLDFMKSCEICFELDFEWEKPFSQRRFIVPALLPEEKPDSLIDLWSRIEKKWIVRYEYQFLHYGNLQSFIVRTHEWGTKSALWKNGCQLKDDQGNLALIEGFFNEANPYLQITVTGDNPQTLLDKVRNEFDEIQRDDNVEELWSLNGQDFVRKRAVENAPKQNRQIQTINGVYVDIQDFKYFLQKNPKEIFVKEKQKIKIFVSYASEDRELCDLLKKGLTKHLKVRKDFEYDLWTDKDILLGDEWEDEIDHALKTTNAALLLISASFAASGFINATELPTFFRRKQEEGYRIMPVLVRDYDFEQFGNVSKLQFFKPHHGDYGFNNPAEKDEIMPFDKLVENNNVADGIRETYYKNLAAEIDKMVRKTLK